MYTYCMLCVHYIALNNNIVIMPSHTEKEMLFLSNVVEIHTKYGSQRSGGPDAINVVVVGASVCRSVCDLFREPNWERFQPSPFG